jgi:tRNA pseudouridine55 synthase
VGRRKGLPIDGVLLLNKPRGVSSNAALQRARRALGAAKAGHTGTLDPMASGLLPVAFGEATKFSQYLLDADKVYLAEVRLGITTNTGDAEGEITGTWDHRPAAQEVRLACERFVGEIDQVPPMYSALKRDGKALYEYARAGVEVERQPRRVQIHAIDVVDIGENGFTIRVRCSKGTYIRSLAEDLGKFLGCGAHLSGLVREATGPFSLSEAVTLEDFEGNPQELRVGWLLPVEAFVLHFPAVELGDEDAARIVHGQVTRLTGPVTAGAWRLYDHGRFLGLGRVDEESTLAPLRLLAT